MYLLKLLMECNASTLCFRFLKMNFRFRAVTSISMLWPTPNPSRTKVL